MKNIILVVGLFISSIGFSMDQNQNAEWMKYAVPSEGHKKFTELTGKWTYTAKMWMTPDAKPEESNGKSTAKLIFGGRYLQEEAKAKMGKMNFEGMSIVGYDNMKKEYQSIWIDNMGTGMMVSNGTADNDVMRAEGEMTCPMTGEKDRKYRTELKIADKNTHTYSMFTKDKDSGKEFKMMEIEYKRAM